jgi:hypothetical protein
MNPKVTTENNKGKATIFKNPFLESLTKTSLKSNIIVYGAVIALMIYNALFIKNISFYNFYFAFYFCFVFLDLC